MEPIAVVGIGCRFPGSATSPSELWQMLRRGDSAWSEIPKDRLNVSSYFHPSGNRQGSIPFTAGHFLVQDVGAFDSSFFSIPADEAKAIDPQQRMLLEVAVEALDSAGIDRTALKKSDTGVWVGSFVKDYEQIVLRDPDNSPKYGATGNGIAIMSNRISFFLDVNGPSMTIDTGCSASLVCVHNACQSLRDGEIDVGLAGGAGLILTPNTMMPMTALNFLSPDGKCYTFDARANGYGRGEGIGIVVMKRLSDAIRDNDNIRAVIRGSNVNQDGRTPGITLPSAEAQLRNIRTVYKRAGLLVDDTAYVECHGTGTQAGDWRELKAISDAFCPERNSADPLYVGSVKTNIGHLEGCAGIAGLVKGILTIENGMIPKHLNFEAPGNPAIDFNGWKVKVPIDNTPWPTEGLRRASVNCFGFGGTNAHVIIDDAAHYLAQRGLSAHHNTTLDGTRNFSNLSTTTHEWVRSVQGLPIPTRDSKTHLFIFSAHEQKVLSQMLKDYASYAQGQLEPLPGNIMEDLAYSLGCRRTQLQWRASVVARSPEELIQKLVELPANDLVRASEDKSSTKSAFVFGGQGAQWFAMGRELLGFDAFLQSIEDASSYLQTHLDAPFSLLAELLKDESRSLINKPEISQPATTAIQVALVDLLTKYFGVTPNYVCGHSSGEIAAAYALGALSREDAWELAFHRGRCAGAMLALQDQPPSKGSMLAVGLPSSEAHKYVDVVGNDKVVVACINSPVSVTLSGDEGAIQELQRALQAAGVFNRLLIVDIAYHSHHMKRCEDAYLKSITHIKPKKPRRGMISHPHIRGGLVKPEDIRVGTTSIALSNEAPVMYSSVTGHVISWEDLSPEYWVRNMASPVLFADAMHSMMSVKNSEKPSFILEVGPHSSLQGPIRQILDAEEKLRQRPVYSSLLRRGRDATVTLLEATGKLWGNGFEIVMPWVVMRNVQTERPRLLVDLPKYPWNRDKVYWHESHLSLANRFQVHGRYDLIGRPTADSIPFQPRWRGFFRVSENPWLLDHQVQKTIIYPAAGMATMVLEAAKQLASEHASGFQISEFKIQKAMIIPNTEHGLEYALNLNQRASQMAVAPIGNVESPSLVRPSLSFEFSVYSKPLDKPWEEHGNGYITIHYHESSKETNNRYYQAYLNAKKECDNPVNPRQLYESLDVIGMNYGRLFQNIESLHKRDGVCVGTIRIPDTKYVMPANFEYPHIIHPTTLDSVFQTALGFENGPMVPSFIGSLYISANSPMLSGADKQLVAYTYAKSNGRLGATASFAVSDQSWLGNSGGNPLMIIEDMAFTALNPSTTKELSFLPNHRSLCSEIIWEEIDILVNPNEPHTKLNDNLLILIPMDTSPDINALQAELVRKLNCQFRTLGSIKENEILPRHCISLLEADGQALFWNWTEQEFLAFQNVISAVKGIFWITRGSQLEARNPQASLAQALGRTIQSEYPKKKLVTFDISIDLSFASSMIAPFVQTVLSLVARSFFGPKVAGPIETEYIERNGRIMVPRLATVDSLNSMIERGSAPAEPDHHTMPDPHERPLKLKIGQVGDIGSLYWSDDLDANLPLPPDSVRVRVIMAALDNLDLEIMYGHVDKGDLGTDMYGVVDRTGEDVTSVVPGDCVVGIARGSLRDFVTCHHRLLYKVPSNQPKFYRFYLPTSFAVAGYALGKLKAGDTILIHAGVGTFGQTAIQLAKSAGAVVFASGETGQERDTLRNVWGLPEDNILDAGTEAFVDTVLCLTDNQGGRVINFANKPSRKDMTTCETDVTGKTFSCTIINVPHLVEYKPGHLGDALASIYPKLLSWQSGIWNRDLQDVYDYSDLAAAFTALNSDTIGASIYCQRPKSKPVPILPRAPPPTSSCIHGNATYVLSGGLGGLGIEVAKLLVANGAKNIVFLGRSGATNESAKSCINFLRKKQVNVEIFKVDICNVDAVDRIGTKIRESMPPVKGVFQCAAVLRDSVFENMTYEDWQLATKPKTVGSWNLHQTFGNDLDFFVFLSSSAGVIGNRGQANYAAGNAFQDALARHIKTMSEGKVNAVSIDLGPVLEAGMLADDPQTLDKLKASGFFGIRLQDIKRIVERAITGYMEDGRKIPIQVVTGVGTGGLILQNKPADPYWTRSAIFTRLNQVDMPKSSEENSEEASGSREVMQRLLAQATDAKEARCIVSECLREMLSRSMNMDSADVDESRPPSAYGVDSLVAVGVRNWVSRECEADVSIFEVLSETSISDLSAIIVQRREKE
ncbi:ketoacyl-synt-domain-containing protein [Daldinia caldariorum]|uniref:ketoacyl-synt-domain-containing protein n=1 Tax=Daldinia caldariorum TaxID=326644 RepID=UPI0020080B6D|nr:ketoacyl-synt-domain-containing protein [Daldinia caldariorum]KAI1462907.1 ketoacyl-synt-domain-containing protein [Daldinia caldariorum]